MRSLPFAMTAATPPQGDMKYPKVIDADGHIYENHEEIEKFFEGNYGGMRRARDYPLFPSLDGWPPASDRTSGQSNLCTRASVSPATT
jgi:hypothetical protein